MAREHRNFRLHHRARMALRRRESLGARSAHSRQESDGDARSRHGSAVRDVHTRRARRDRDDARARHALAAQRQQQGRHSQSNRSRSTMAQAAGRAAAGKSRAEELAMHRTTPLVSAFVSYVSGGCRATVDQVDDSKLMQEMSGAFMKFEQRGAVESPQDKTVRMQLVPSDSETNSTQSQQGTSAAPSASSSRRDFLVVSSSDAALSGRAGSGGVNSNGRAQPGTKGQQSVYKH